MPVTREEILNQPGRDEWLERLAEQHKDKTKDELNEMIDRSLLGGSCSFCGVGGGYLGETGDESTQVMHGGVRTGEPGDWKYGPHPNALNSQVVWCGQCIGGLQHKWQRYDDQNLKALQQSYKVRIAMDGPKWIFWELAREEEERQKVIDSGLWPDDISVHMDKLRIERDLEDIQNEQFRRAGFDLTTRGWRE